MKLFQRVKRSFTVSVESLLDQVENQEAVAQAAIREIEAATARVRLARRRSERRASDLETRAAELEQASANWRARAVRLRDQHERAVECVKRALSADRARQHTLSQLEHERGVALRIGEDEAALTAKLHELRSRHALLGSREARADALGFAAAGEQVEHVFDRWEARIEEREMRVEVAGAEAVDTFGRELAAEEERALLERELERLVNGEPAK